MTAQQASEPLTPTGDHLDAQARSADIAARIDRIPTGRFHVRPVGTIGAGTSSRRLRRLRRHEPRRRPHRGGEGSLPLFRALRGLGLGAEVPVAATLLNEYLGRRNRGRVAVLDQTLFSWGLFVAPLIACRLVSAAATTPTVGSPTPVP